MKIVKVLNNNVVLSKDEKDNEVILMGRGLAFQKRPGDFLEEERIDKRYQLEDEISRQFQELLVDVPLTYLELATTIIDYAKETLKTPLSDSIYISVTDHLYTLELLIHIGLDTVQLEGKHFTSYVKQGDKVKRGQKLVAFDIKAIQEAGYSVETPVIITNSGDYLDIIESDKATVNCLDELITALA